MKKLKRATLFFTGKALYRHSYFSKLFCLAFALLTSIVCSVAQTKQEKCVKVVCPGPTYPIYYLVHDCNTMKLMTSSQNQSLGGKNLLAKGWTTEYYPNGHVKNNIYSDYASNVGYQERYDEHDNLIRCRKVLDSAQPSITGTQYDPPGRLQLLFASRTDTFSQKCGILIVLLRPPKQADGEGVDINNRNLNTLNPYSRDYRLMGINFTPDLYETIDVTYTDDKLAGETTHYRIDFRAICNRMWQKNIPANPYSRLHMITAQYRIFEKKNDHMIFADTITYIDHNYR